MTTKFTDAGAYEIAKGVGSAEEAAKLGLAVVEVDPTSGRPTRWGRYKDAPEGGPLGITTAKAADTEVKPGGAAAGSITEPTPDGKGHPDDPFVKTPVGVETIHADGSPPGVLERDLGNAETLTVDEGASKEPAKPAKK